MKQRYYAIKHGNSSKQSSENYETAERWTLLCGNKSLYRIV